MHNHISIIIPTCNEQERISGTLAHLHQLFDMATTEIIVVDQSDTRQTMQQVLQFPQVRYLRSTGETRGSNLHQGAVHARHELFLFLHADTHLPSSASLHLSQLDLNRYRYGAFRRTFDIELAPIAQLVNRSHLAIAKQFSYLYGDQAIFVSREAYAAVGGYQPWPLFEDVNLARRLSRYARMTGTKMKRIDDPVITSARKFADRGARQAIAFMSRMSILYHIGVHPHKIAQIYYQ